MQMIKKLIITMENGTKNEITDLFKNEEEFSNVITTIMASKNHHGNLLLKSEMTGDVIIIENTLNIDTVKIENLKTIKGKEESSIFTESAIDKTKSKIKQLNKKQIKKDIIKNVKKELGEDDMDDIGDLTSVIQQIKASKDEQEKEYSNKQEEMLQSKPTTISKNENLLEHVEIDDTPVNTMYDMTEGETQITNSENMMELTKDRNERDNQMNNLLSNLTNMKEIGDK